MNQANKIKLNWSKVGVTICRLCGILVIVCILIFIVTCVLSVIRYREYSINLVFRIRLSVELPFSY